MPDLVFKAIQHPIHQELFRQNIDGNMYVETSLARYTINLPSMKISFICKIDAEGECIDWELTTEIQDEIEQLENLLVLNNGSDTTVIDFDSK